MTKNTTIVAIATPPGVGAIAVIRLSGNDAIAIVDKIFRPRKKNLLLSQQEGYTVHFGQLMDGNIAVDEVLITLFKSPHSYTGEDTVEISCHGSIVIQQQIVELLIKHGAVAAQAGEFTLRAFLNGKMDLSQAEGVADLIASDSEVAKRVALHQMRGGFSEALKNLREKLLHFISLIELELDFSEEDVEFADRAQLRLLIEDILSHTNQLITSFSQGNVIKNGVPIAIIGKPNVGKSTLLNQILKEEKAIVTDIAGTTRDTIEDTISIEGINFRFIDTAGLRHTTDVVESLGIERAMEKIASARIILLTIDALDEPNTTIEHIQSIKQQLNTEQQLIIVINKTDTAKTEQLNGLMDVLSRKFADTKVLPLSAKHNENVPQLLEMLVKEFEPLLTPENSVIITNARHYHALHNAQENLASAIAALDDGIPTDLLAMDIRQVLHYIGEITGEITTEEVLGSIFAKFCIGK